MLSDIDFFLDFRWEILLSELSDCVLSRSTSSISLDIEKFGRLQKDLCRIIEVNTVSAIGKLVTQTVFF